jgi:hypothetical protein
MDQTDCASPWFCTNAGCPLRKGSDMQTKCSIVLARSNRTTVYRGLRVFWSSAPGHESLA